MSLTNLTGISGAFIILMGFTLNELHKLDRDSIVYDLLNLVGGILLAFYAYILSSTPFLILNVVWAIVALRDVVIDLKKNRQTR